MLRPVRRLLWVCAIASVGLAGAGCGNPRTPSRARTSGTTRGLASTSSRTIASPATTAPGEVPTLGQMAGIFATGGYGRGFGQVEPSDVYNGGDPTGQVTNIEWGSWGGPQATGAGISEYVGPNQMTVDGTEEPATIVAFNLGVCDGKYMYRAVEWYFPQHGGRFDPNQYEDICKGTYVPDT